MFGVRQRLRVRIALEFMLFAGAIHALLLGVLVVTRESQLLRQFDDELVLRVSEVASLVRSGDDDRAVQVLRELDESEPGSLTYYQLYRGGKLVTASAGATTLLLPERRPALGQAPVLEDLDGEGLGRPGERFRMASMAIPGPGRDILVLEAVSPLSPVRQTVGSLKRLAFLFVLPIATVASGVAAFLVGGRIFRRIGQVAQAAAGLSPGVAAAPGARRLGVPTPKDEIGEMVAEMNGLLARLEAAYAAQDKFILDVTHELKTPLSAIFGQAQLLRQTAPGDRPEAFRSFVSSVTDEMRVLGEFLESLLVLLRAGHGKFVASETVHINYVVVDAAERWGAAARGGGVGVSVSIDEEAGGDPDPIVKGDHGMLVTMVANMLTAVAAQAARPGTIELTVTRANGEVIVRVGFREPVLAQSEGGAGLPGDGTPNTRRVEVRMGVAEGVAQMHGGHARLYLEGSPEAVARLPEWLRINQAAS
jgi:signal transduction histidine kinase